jgi:cell filamentation protein
MGPLFEWAGEYRTVQSFVGRGDYQTTPPRFIDAEMREFDDLLGEVSSKLESRDESDRSFWLLLARIYFELCRIHPFRDGNGRVSRLVMTAFIGREAQRPAPLDWESLKRASNQTDRAFEAARDDSNLKPLAWLLRKAFRKGRGN